MTKFISRAITIAVSVALCGALLFGAYIGINRLAGPDPALQSWLGGSGFSLEAAQYIEPGSGTLDIATRAGNPSATTSVVYLRTSDTATSSISGVYSRGEKVSLNILFNASSTASVLNAYPYVSHNGIDWFGYDCVTATSNILTTHGSTTCVQTWNPQIAGMSRKTMEFSLPPAKWYRIDFGVTGANATVWMQGVVKEVVPN